DEPEPVGRGDAVHDDGAELVVPVVLAGQGGRQARRRRLWSGTCGGGRAAEGEAREAHVVDLAARLQQLEDMIREAKSMPLSSSALLNREEILELGARMRGALPEGITRARGGVRDG